MKTLRIPIDPNDLNSENSRASIKEAASILRGGGLVAFPTETVYGLGANALNSEAVAGIFRAKQRPAWDPVIAHISGPSMLSAVIAPQPLTTCAQRLTAAYWPGPLTLLLPKADLVPSIVTAGRPLVGVRMPANAVARALIAAAGTPIAAPSANRFGRISPTTAAHVLEDLDGRIDAVLDGGETSHGLESTVVDASAEPVVVYRPGIITLEEIRRICGSAIMWISTDVPGEGEEPAPASLPSPGTGIRHYAPRAHLMLIAGEFPRQASDFAQAVKQVASQRRRFGVMLPRNFTNPGAFANPGALEPGDNSVVFDWGDWQNLAQLGHRLFAGLRELDSAGVEVILCPLPPPSGIGAALQDRLLKAAKRE
jgi:L-threonylcarbamoyladenylate synthase